MRTGINGVELGYGTKCSSGCEAKTLRRVDSLLLLLLVVVVGIES